MGKLIEFNGRNFVLMGGGRYYLSTSTTSAGRKNPKGLHVAIWEYHSGQQVPKGYEINHKDGNTHNNDFSNLECLPRNVHRLLPKRIDIKKVKNNLDKQRPLATAWHKSPEGIEWHKQHAKNCWDKGHPSIQKYCKFCDNSFITKVKHAVFCSLSCRGKLNYWHESSIKGIKAWAN